MNKKINIHTTQLGCRLAQYLCNFFIFSLLLLIASGCRKSDLELPDLSGEYPRILSNWPPKTADGLPGEFNVLQGRVFEQQIIYTPISYATCIWFMDGKEVARGDTFTFTPTKTGRHYIKVIVQTSTAQTFREATLKISQP